MAKKAYDTAKTAAAAAKTKADDATKTLSTANKASTDA